MVWSPCRPRDSQESSPASQFESINSSAFFMVQLSHPYMTTGKTIALTRKTFVCKVMSLLFNMLSSFVIGFHPRSKQLLISWLQSPSAVTLESKKIILYCTLKIILIRREWERKCLMPLIKVQCEPHHVEPWFKNRKYLLCVNPICQTLLLGAPKSLQMVTATMKLKDTYSLEEKLWPT